MNQDKAIIVKSSEIKPKLARAWRGAVEAGGPVIVTTNGVPDFVIYPLKRPVHLVVEMDALMVRVRDIYYELLIDRSVPLHLKHRLPRLGPDRLRREAREAKTEMHMLMTPYAWTNYSQVVGVLFPIPVVGAWYLVEQLDRAMIPERYTPAEDV